MKTLLSLFFALLVTPALLLGQKTNFVSNQIAPNIYLNAGIIKHPKGKPTMSQHAQYIKYHCGLSQPFNLELIHEVNSKKLAHYWYQLYYNKIKVYGALYHLSTDFNEQVFQLSAPQIDELFQSNLKPNVLDAVSMQKQFGADSIIESDVVWLKSDAGYFEQGLAITLLGPIPLYREILMVDNQIIQNVDLFKHHHAHDGPNDSLVDIMIYNPDPLTSAMQPYGAPYFDNSDIPTKELNDQRKIRQVRFNYINGTFYPQNDYVRIVELSPPFTNSIASSDHQYLFQRNQPGFEDVNVIYHMTKHCQYLESLGYPNLPGYRLDVDAHALNGADDAGFVASTNPPSIYFGTGGVDDAEDADVIIHELTHAVIDAATPVRTTNTESGTIEEALGDYFAASYSKAISNWDDGYVCTWDGRNEFWGGRSVRTENSYKNAQFLGGNVYAHTSLLAAAHLEIYDLLGRTISDELVMESIFSLRSNTSMPEWAELVLFSDSLLNGAANFATIHIAFAKRGILTPLSTRENEWAQQLLQLKGTHNFAQGGLLRVENWNNSIIEQYELYNITGVKIVSKQVNNAHFDLSGQDLQAGSYLLHVIMKDGYQQNFKVLRF